MLKKRKFVISGIIIIAAVASLAYVSFQSSATYYYTVSELTGQGSLLYDENVRINGLVAPGSLEQKPAGGTLTFTIIDIEGAESLPVVYQGVVPDTFKVGNEVVVEGYLNSNGSFQAHTLMTKCPSKYEPE